MSRRLTKASPRATSAAISAAERGDSFRGAAEDGAVGSAVGVSAGGNLVAGTSARAVFGTSDDVGGVGAVSSAGTIVAAAVRGDAPAASGTLRVMRGKTLSRRGLFQAPRSGAPKAAMWCAAPSTSDEILSLDTINNPTTTGHRRMTIRRLHALRRWCAA